MATAITAKTLIDEAQKRHALAHPTNKSHPSPVQALGESLIAGLLLSSNCKAGERISLSVKGEGFLKHVLVDALPDGSVRGFLISRAAEVPPVDSTLGPWQKGLLSVVRLKLGEKEPYVGTVPIVTGHLAKDLTFYLLQSEQIPAAVGLAVNFDRSGKVESAGGFLVQVVPGASKKEIARIEQNINKLQSLAREIAKNSDPTVLLGQIFDDMTFIILDEKPLRFECSWSKERIVRALMLLGKDELRDMMSQDHGAKVHCDFCSKLFDISESELDQIIKQLGAKAE